MILETSTGPLYYEINDMTPPWVEHPQTIVFCHGVAVNCDIWMAWLPVLASHFRIVRFDMRSFGRSPAPLEGSALSLEGLADDIVFIAEAAGVERFHLVGESMGGTVSLQLASRLNSPVLSLICVSTAHRGALILRLPEWKDLILKDGMETWSHQMMGNRFFEGALTELEWEWFHRLQSKTNANALIQAGELLMRIDLSADLPKIVAPTLLLTPDSSPFVSVEISNEARKLITNSELAVFPHTRHGLPYSDAQICAEAVLEFLMSPRIHHSAR